jgi:hypothetical protein
MAKQIKNTDIIDKGVFDVFLSEVAEAEKALDGLENKFSELGKKAKGSVEGFDLGKTADIKKLDDVIQDLVKSIEELSKVQKQRRDIDQALTKEQKAIIKLNKDNKDSVEDNRIELQKLRIEKREQTKIDKRAAIQISDVTSEYQKQSARLQTLRDSQKDLALEGKQTTAVFIEQQKEIDDLDKTLKDVDASVGQFQRSVGNYAKFAKETGQVNNVVNLSFKEQTTVLNSLQEEYKTLIVRGQGATTEATNLAQAIDVLNTNVKEASKANKDLIDGQKDLQKEAKRSADEVERLGDKLDNLQNGALAVGGVLAGGGLIKSGLSSTQEGAEELGDSMALLSFGLTGVLVAFLAFTKAIEDGKGLFEAAKLFESTLKGTGALVPKLLQLRDASKDFEKVTLGVGGALIKTNKGLQTFLETFGGPFITAGTLESIDALKGLKEELRDLVGDLDISDNNLTKLASTFEILSEKADQNTRNLEERAELTQQASIISEEFLSVESARLKAEVSIAKERERILIESKQVFIEASRERSAAQVALTEFEGRQQLQRQQNAERFSQIIQDQAELDLDVLIDQFDNQKSINERIISDENKTVEFRKALLDETNKQFNDSFLQQSETVQKLADTQKALNNLTDKSSAITQSAIDKELKLVQAKKGRVIIEEEIDKILKLSAVQQVEAIKNLSLSENITIRSLEILRDRRTGEQDLLEASKELNESQAERNIILEDTIAQENALKDIRDGTATATEALDTLEDDRTKNRINQLTKEIDLRKLAGEEIVEQQQELNDILLDLEKDKTKDLKTEKDKQAKDDKIAADKELSNRTAVITALEEIQKQNSKRRIEGLNDEIEDSKRRQQTLEILAAQGSEDADKNLANERKLQNDAELERKKQIRREKIEEFALAGIKAYSANAGEPNAVGKTLTDLALVSAGIRALLPAYDGYDGEGTDDSGPTQGNRDSFGGIKGFFHDREQVWSKKDRSAVGWRGRDEIKDIVKAHDSKVGSFDTPVVVSSSGFDSSAEVLKKFDRLESAIKNQPKQQNYYDAYKKAIVEEVREGNRVTRNHRKVGGLFGGSKN